MKNEKAVDEMTSCPIHKTLELFQGKWNTWILFELSKKKSMRFGELKKAIPEISNTMLASTLKNLEVKELINRMQFNEIPPHVEYSSTVAAKELQPIFDAMYAWGEKHIK
jgi:Predicted transcriptional regulators